MSNTTTEQTTEQIIRYLNAHDTGATPTCLGTDSSGRLVVRCTECDASGTRTVSETIEPTMRAARVWLGY